MTRPFRWDVARREQLGMLARGDPAESYEEFLNELRRCSARVVATAGDARLVFVGRSPESLYDYLTGALAETSWSDRLFLLNVSMRQLANDGSRADAAAFAAIRAQFAAQGIDPATIATGPHPVALVDLIDTGDTLGRSSIS